MRWVSAVTVIAVATMAAACGIYEDVPVWSGDVLEEGDPCGPCELGIYAEGSCELGQLEGAIGTGASCEAVVFVSAQAGDDAEGAGTQDEPFASVAAAVQAGNEGNASVVVVAGDDVHEGAVQLGDGLSIIGGFTEEWQTDLATKPVIRSEAEDEDEDSEAVLAVGLRRPTVLRNLRIEASGSAKTHYGMRVVDSKELVLERVRVVAAAGGDGAAGASGGDGEEGEEGGHAGASARRDAGDAGENTACGEAGGGAGGRGGLEAPDSSQRAEAGVESVAGVAGGAMGDDGEDGSEGAPGSDGSLSAEGVVDAGRWVLGDRGTEGEDGDAGEGGGGGGGGVVQGGDGAGGGGGGGGAGGCGGQGGQGGEAGGASFGMLVVDSEMVVRDSELESSDGGAGGEPGEGGLGGDGGLGGRGSSGEEAGQAGGDGGQGGQGGAGGDGGSGQGGVSYGMFCAGDVTVSIENSELRFGSGGMIGGDGEELASSGKSAGCGL